MHHRLPELADVAKLRTLTNLFYKATGVPLFVIDHEGAIVARPAGKDLCDRFLRANPETNRRCRRNDRSCAVWVGPGRKYAVEKCSNGLFEALLPITLFGEHIATFVAGPFFLEPPDRAFFKQQAARFGLDGPAYARALSKVPVVDRGRLDALLQCFSLLAELLGHAGDRKRKGSDELEANLLSNTKELVFPLVEKLKKSGMSAGQRNTLDALESNLRKITTPVIGTMQAFGLSARESTIASLIKEGKTTKQIADLLVISRRAVEFHRYNIRRKLGLDHKKTNLRAYLLSAT